MRASAHSRGGRLAFVAGLCLLLLFAKPIPAQTQSTPVPLVRTSAIAFDAQGNLYFAETGNHVIRKLSLGGAVTTVAGSGVQGFSGDHGLATAAELDSPAGLALDALGDLYIADTHNHCIREVAAATGIITTIAGTGVAGYSGDGGAAKAAQLDLPTALALDPTGNVYVADSNNHRIRRIATATGLITTVAGDRIQGFSGDNGAATSAAIDSPNGLATDAAGNLYLADTYNNRVRKVSMATGIITTAVGTGNEPAFSGDGGAGTAAGLALPRGLSIDAAGNLYIADSANHRIRRISSAGTITTVVGQGTETFAGDEAPAVSASRDTPRSVAISPEGLLTLTDSQNHRIRQLDLLPAPDIHTIVGVGITPPGTLVISGPSVTSYGNGILTATLSATTNATGSVTFLDNTSGTAVPAGASSLIANSATVSISGLAAGSHSLVAIYAGDATHPAAQSSALALNVMPLGIVATANSVSILYGQTIPSISGALNGIVTQDANKVAPTFTTSAVLMSPVGIYPIAATLTGSAAGNYTVSLTPASLNIAQAPSLITLSASTNMPGLGLPVTLNMQAASTTTGVPTGSITLLDGSTVLSVAQLSSAGATFTTSTLSLGAHRLSVVYSGDTNFLPSTSTWAALTVGAASDLILTSSGVTSQTISAGSAVTFSFSVAMQGAAMASPITLAVQGTPLGATASLSPSSLPPGGAVTGFTLTIQTPLAGLDMRARPFVPGNQNLTGSILLALLLPFVGCARRRALKRLGGLSILFVGAASCMLLTTLTTGCGDRIHTAPESANERTYTLTVTGTATSSAGTAMQHSANVTLRVL